MPRYDLEGQAAVVTGAGRGIGRAIALRLAREGAGVTVADLDEANAQKVTAEIRAAGGRANGYRVDVTQKDDVERMVYQTVEWFGRLDIQVNNAGIGIVAPLLETDEEAWDTLMNVNAKGVLLCSQSAARQMIAQGNGGRIINNASGAGKIAPGKATPRLRGEQTRCRRAHQTAGVGAFGSRYSGQLRLCRHCRHPDVGFDRSRNSAAARRSYRIGQGSGRRQYPAGPYSAAGRCGQYGGFFDLVRCGLSDRPDL